MKCNLCGKYFDDSGSVMLNNELWNKISDNNKIPYMCYDCITKKLGREIVEDDLLLTGGHHWLVNKWFLDNKVKNPKYKLIFEHQDIPCGFNLNDSTITTGMEYHLITELTDHINHVIKIARKLLRKGYIDKSIYDKIKNHDKSKFKDPEYIPYVKRRWEEFKFPGKDYHKMSDDIKNAVVHHVTHNDHHPEYWSKDYQGFKSDDPCHINFMPEDSIIEMACDWKDMGNEHGNKAIDWFNKTDGSRWIWDPNIKNKVIKWINIVDHLDDKILKDRVNKLFN